MTYLRSATTALLACALAWSANTHPLRGDVVYLKEGEPLFGIVIQQDEDRVVLNQRVPGRPKEDQRPDDEPAYRQRSIPRKDIRVVIRTIDPVRLAELQPDGPTDYRNLAEEMAVQKTDPEARDLAIRLYLIAAWHGDHRLRSRCLAALVELARDANEAKRLRALAHIHARELGPWLIPPSPGVDASPPLADESLRKTLEMIVALRQHRTETAMDLMKRPEVQNVVSQFYDITTIDQLEDWAIGRELSVQALARVVELEVAVADSLSGISSEENRSSWSRLALEERQTPTSGEAVTLLNATEFDPRAASFVDGEWVIRDSD